MRHSTCAGEDVTVTVFDIAQYFYCPRKVYYLRVLGAPTKPRKKMEVGREEQSREEERLTERKTIYGFEREKVKEVVYRPYLEAPDIGLAGQLDVLLKMEDGELIPVDSKYTEGIGVPRQYRKQIVAYVVLLDHAFGIKTKRGIIYFPQQKEAVEVTVTEEDKHSMSRDIQRIRQILLKEVIPRKVADEKCGYCEVRRYCV
ncbi:MAG: CRISPR-associated protein Cas4 [Candidatus Verstraetearchaeota archaeon]|nr:CRISPR-associated protein Cas4 [Candidatus Verstraetearchaeota archaeon]